MPTTKIATCCYCGTRAALRLEGERRHELACSGCGAPLHNLKSLRVDAVDPEAHRPPRKGKRKRAPEVHASRRETWEPPLKKPKKKKKKRRKSPAYKLLSEAFDLIEDIFD
ncbi:hypothetical protein [Mameliella alba]|uniref:hypothetical protein n=1 Tax=Mameliella alba TaxID=561184 RepID=UPI000B537C57|nr:hypothetical protein [Mameliella alba]MBY6118386.1 hypothetical protein [Mameliella alba]OWV43341.1 hypothetical protein CDZ95_11175 [Mameliella alba]OWV68478.1 hypothetical protein CDZ97_01530 [Mameliella alba]